MSVSHVSHSAPRHAATTPSLTRSAASGTKTHASTLTASVSKVHLHPPARSATAHVAKALADPPDKTTPALATSGTVGTKINTVA